MNGTPGDLPHLAVGLGSTPEDLAALGPLLAAVGSAVGNVPALLKLATTAEGTAPKPGEGRTAFLC